MAEDIWQDLPVDGEFQLTQEFLNRNVRDATALLLSPPTCILVKTNTQTLIATPTWTAISWNSLICDTEDPAVPIFNVSQPTRLTCRTAGYYEVTCQVTSNISNSGNSISMAYQINGDANKIYAGDGTDWDTVSQQHGITSSLLIPMLVGDYLEVIIRISRVVNEATSNGGGGPRVSFRRVRGL
jgi:hypothetical protein